MKSNANWYMRVWAAALVLVLVVAALACGGGGNGVVNMNSSATNGGDAVASGVSKTTGVLVTEEQVATLPAWQQELLNDPGWNQPYIEPREGTPIEPPTNEMLEEYFEAELAKSPGLSPRGAATGGKAASWNDQGGFTEDLDVGRGEYATYNGSGTPPFGCNINTTNDYNSKNKGSEDAIFNYSPYTGPSQRISYVLRGSASNNHFINSAGAGNNVTNAVYQLFSSFEGADPTDPNSTADFAELSYRADMAIDPGTGDPGAPGGECPNAEAFQVSDLFWSRFNSDFDALPNNGHTPLYNVFIAPSSDAMGPETSSFDTDALYQSFYLGDQDGPYNGAWIVGLQSSTGACDTWQEMLTSAAGTDFFYRPIYGVLMARWNDSMTIGSAGPWESLLGWPVFGPVPYASGSPTLNARGAFYAWGMWFERGFIWWKDYDQALNPDTPDEADLYVYTGSNVYCKDGMYEPVRPTTYYGANGDLGVVVTVDAMRYQATDPWAPVPVIFDGINGPHQTGSYIYTVPLPSGDGLGTVTLAMHATGYGGTPNADGIYKHYIWAFRDGTLSPAGPDYSDSNRFVQHVYGDTLDDMQSIYVVRVQITDSTDTMAYGDSYPVALGNNGGAGGGDNPVLLVRNDNGNYDDNYDAIVSDLQAIADDRTGGSAFWDVEEVDNGEAFTTDTTAYDVVIWYRGGATNSGSPLTLQYSPETTQALLDIMDAGTPLLHMSGNAASGTSGWYWEINTYYSPAYDMSYPGGRNAWETEIMGVTNFFGSASGSLNATNDTGSPWECHGTAGSLGERYTSNGASSGKQAITVAVPGNNQVTCTTMIFDSSGAQGGVSTDTRWDDYMSWGNPALGGGMYFVGYPWDSADVGVSDTGDMERYHMLQNILASLGGEYMPEGGGAPAYNPYDGPPEIISVTPSFFDGTGALEMGATTLTYSNPAGYSGGAYPDQTSTNVYRTTAPGSGNYIVTGNPNNDWINANDLDFQFPWYGFVYDADRSLSDPDWDGFGSLPQVSGDEVFLGYNGLVVEDPDTIWERTGKIDWKHADFFDTGIFTDPTNPAWDPGDFLRQAAGYYVTDDDVIATPALEVNVVKAGYGTDTPALSNWDNKYPLMVETVAHWPSSSTIDLAWCMFPGHGSYDPATGNVIPFETADGYYSYQMDFDIDPLASPTGRNTGMYNRPVFDSSLGDEANERRTVEWDMTNVDNWDGDLNADGVRDNADKFPVRVRLYSESFVMPGNWPDHMFDPGSAPSAGTLSSDGDFIEGGCYVVDTGIPLYTVNLYDNPGVIDPFETGAVNWQGGEDFEVTLGYGIEFGTGPYTVELDVNYLGVFGDDDLLDGYEEVYQIEPVAPGNTLLGGGSAPGLREATVNITYPEGDYYFALRVTDASSDTDILWYSDDYASLSQWTATSPFLVVDDGDTAGADALESNLLAIAPSAGGYISVTTVDRVGADELYLNLDYGVTYAILSQYDYVFWSSSDTGYTCALTDEQAEAATDAMQNGLGFLYFKTRMNTGSSAGTTNQRAFNAAISGMRTNYSPYMYSSYIYPKNQIASGPGGSVSGYLCSSYIPGASTYYYAYNYGSPATGWAQEDSGYANYWTGTYSDYGLGKAGWLSCHWGAVYGTKQQTALHNMLFTMDSTAFGVPVTEIWSEDFESATLGGVPAGWGRTGSQGSKSQDWEVADYHAGSDYPYGTGCPWGPLTVGADSTSQWLSFTATTGSYGDGYYGNSVSRYVYSEPITTTPGTSYVLEWQSAGCDEGSWDDTRIGVTNSAGAGFLSYIELGMTTGTTWTPGQLDFTATSATTYVQVYFYTDSSVDYYGGPQIDEIVLSEL